MIPLGSTPGGGSVPVRQGLTGREDAPKTGTYYNEWDGYAAQWLRNLMAAGHISEGTVDERSIKDVQPGDIPSRAHFFAGIGGWEYALRLAGWPADRPVWTGSCPCQPFSAAGKRAGNLDARHLWPDFYALVRARMPPTIFGEQVASADGRIWLNGVRADLEALGYEVGAADLCAAGVSAPHIRQRLFWVAHTPGERFDRRKDPAGKDGRPSFEDCSHVGGADGWLEHAESDGREQWRPESSWWGAVGRCGSDGKFRRIKPGVEPVANGVSDRVGKLRAQGNAIVPQVAAEFIRAFLEAEGPLRPGAEHSSQVQPLPLGSTPGGDLDGSAEAASPTASRSEEMPPWWTRGDTAMVESFHRWQAQAEAFTLQDLGGQDGQPFTREAEAHFKSGIIDKWTCRRCRFWASLDGVTGACSGPELPLGAGIPGDSMCEQWAPRSDFGRGGRKVPGVIASTSGAVAVAPLAPSIPSALMTPQASGEASEPVQPLPLGSET